MAYQPELNPQPISESDTTASISIAANATASGQVTSPGGAGTYEIELSGTWTATVQIQVTADGANWVNITSSGSVLNIGTGNYMASGNITGAGTTGNGVYQINAAGVAGARVITTAYTSGTVQGVARLSPAPPPVAPSITLSGFNYLTTTSSITNTAAMQNYSNQVGSGSPQTPTAVKTSAGNLYGWKVYNPNSSAVYLQFFFQAAGSVTLGTTTPFMSVGIPALSSDSMMFPAPRASGTAWTIGVTTTWNGGTSPSSPAAVNIYYA